MSRRYRRRSRSRTLDVQRSSAARDSRSVSTKPFGRRRTAAHHQWTVVAQAAGSLAQTFQSLVAAQTDIAWIGYAVPVDDRDRTMCCFSSADGTTWVSGTSSSSMQCCGACRIEPAADVGGRRETGGRRNRRHLRTSVKLEGSERAVILFRIADRQVERIRMFSEDCELDAGGRPVHWLQDVRPAESVALLESLIGPRHGTQEPRQQRGDQRDRRARRAGGGQHPRAARAVARLRPIRGEAIFWLGQKAGRKAVGTISEAIEKDPETEVKKRAVFALSQLPSRKGCRS